MNEIKKEKNKLALWIYTKIYEVTKFNYYSWIIITKNY